MFCEEDIQKKGKISPNTYVTKKLRPRDFAKKKRIKNVKDIGTATSILFAKVKVLSKSLCSEYENIIEIMLISGKAIMNPASTGFFIDNQLAKEIMIPETKTLASNNSISNNLIYPKFLILI